MAKGDEPGGEYGFEPGFHERLARNWPEPREQLHAGGWSMTLRLAQELGIDPEDAVLDVCCGEGGSAVWIALTFGSHVTGVDILCPAMDVANERAKEQGVEALCTFVCGDAFSLPFADGSFDVVFGQDPDGFAQARRIDAFKECFRVLRPGGRLGFHHWIPGVDAPPAIVERFDEANAEAGYPSHVNVSADAYMEAMRAALFQDVRATDEASTYRKHMMGIRDQAREHGEEVDSWTAAWLELADRHPFGVMLLGRKI